MRQFAWRSVSRCVAQSVTTMVVALALALITSSLGVAQAQESEEIEGVFARVIVDSTVARSGPGATYRRVHIAHRGDTFPVRERATRGYWFRVELPDGTSGWIPGDAVYNHEVSDDEAGGFWSKIFAPPPLLVSSGELAVTAGVLGNGGLIALRPSLLLHASFGFEVNAAASVSAAGRLLMLGGGPIVNIFPQSPIVPFATVGGGIAISDPNADTFILQSGSTSMLYGGFGLRFGFRYRLTLRLEARAYAFYTPDRYVIRQELSGGITVFF